MAVYRYPQNDFDRPELLLNLLGSFWATTYQGNSLVADLTRTAGQLAQQTYMQLLELFNSISRFNVPVYHQDNWYALTIRESEINTDPALLSHYTTPTTTQYSLGTTLTYGQLSNPAYFAVTKPAGLEQVKAIFNRLTSPTVELIEGIDYWIEPSVLVFRNNPFQNALIARKDILSPAGAIVDRELVLWVYRGQWDWKLIYEQFGYALRLQLKSSEGYKQFLNAIFDAFTDGTSVRTQQLALAAAFGVPLSVEAVETVEQILEDADKLNIITDQHVYQFPRSSTPLVAVGDVISAGSPLTNLFQVFELNRGTALSPSDVRALTIGEGVLGGGYWGDLTFENQETALVVEPQVAGFTKVSWTLGGFPFDVEKFWNDVHAAGVARNQTLAMLLDIRENPIDQPIAASLPATINPLQFLADNFLRHHAYIVKVRPGSELSDPLDFVPVDQLRKIQPPHTLMLLIVELVYADAPVIMENPGTETAPGYEETLRGFPCMVVVDSMDPEAFLSERVRINLIGGRCV